MTYRDGEDFCPMNVHYLVNERRRYVSYAVPFGEPGILMPLHLVIRTTRDHHRLLICLSSQPSCRPILERKDAVLLLDQ